MSLLRTSLLTFISTSVKVVSGLAINKAVAFFIGPGGLAVIGQFYNFTQIAMTAAQGAINNGIVKYTAEYNKDSRKLSGLFSTSLRISLVCSVVTGSLMILLSKSAASYFLKNTSYAYVFVVFGLTVVFFSLNGVLLSILNGLQEISIFVKANIVQSLSSLVLTCVLIFYFRLDGALIAMVTNQSLVFFVLLYRIRKHPLIRWPVFTSRFDKSEARKLFGFSAMALVSAVITPLSQVFVRDYITRELGIEAAGLWQAMWYISTVYLLVVTTSLSVYYLPRLSALTDNREVKAEIFNGYKLIIPFVIVLSAIMFLCRDLIIQILFTTAFHEIRYLFLFQLIGDVIKLCAWLLSYLMLAKAMTRVFIITEVVFVSSFVLLSVFFLDRFGLPGVTYAYALNYLLYLGCMILIFRKKLST